MSLTTSDKTIAPEFLSGGGEMGQRIRDYDWTATPLGHPQQWPQSLKTCVRILLTSPQPMFVWWGKETLINIYNDAYSFVLGDKHPAALGQPANQVWKEIWEMVGVRAQIVFTKNEGTFDDGLLLVMNRYGYDEETYFKFSYNPIPGEDGGTEGLFCVCTEETEQVKARKALEETNRQLQFGATLTQSIADAVIGTSTLKEGYHITSWNKGAEHVYGWKADEVTGKPAREVLATQFNTEEDRKAWQTALDEKGNWRGEVVQKRKDGTLVWIDASIAYIKDKDGTILGAVAVNRNITAQKEAEEKLKLTQKQLELTIENVPAAVYLFDDKARVLYLNKQGRDHLSGILGQDFNPEESLETLLKKASARIEYFDEHGQPLSAERYPMSVALRTGNEAELLMKRVYKQTGKEEWFLNKVNPLLDENGKVQFILNTATDFTAQKEIEEKLRENKDQLEFAIEATELATWDFNPITNTFTADARYAEWFGITAKEATDNNLALGIIAEEDRERVIEAYTSALVYDLGRKYDIIYTIRPKNKPERILRAKGKAYFNENKIAYRFNGTLQDVTEQVRAHKKAEEAEARFRLALRGSSHIVFSQDRDLKHTWIYNSHPDFNADAIIGKTDEELHEPQTAQRLMAIKKGVLQSGNSVHGEVAMMVNGINLSYDLWVEPLKNKAGETEGITGVAVDITDRVAAKKKLEESEQQFRSLANSIPQLAWMTDAEGWIYWYNQRWYDYTGTTLEEMQGWGWQKVHHPGLIEGVIERFKKAVASGVPWEDTFLLKSSKGEYRWFLSRAHPIRNEREEIVQWFGTNTDVSAQREIQEALNEAKNQLELTFQNVPSAIYHFDKDGNILYLNEIGARQLGYQTVDEVLNEKDVFKLRKKLDETFLVLDSNGKILPVTESSAAKSFRTGKPSEVVSQFIHRQTGQFFWLLSKSSPLFNDKGVLIMVLTTATDITLQKTSEQIIRQSEERFRTLSESLPQLVWMTDETGRYEYASSQWFDYSGLDPHEEHTWQLLVHPDDMQPMMQAWNHSLKTGESYIVEARLKNKEGEYRWHFVKGEAVRNEEGNIIKWIGAFTDVHEQKTFAQKLEKLVEERTKELQRSNEDLQQFAHVASHDLKEPVRKVMTFSNRLKHELGDSLSEKAALYLSKMETSVSRMYSMIDGVLLYSSVNAQEQTKDKIKLNEIVQSVASDLEVVIDQKEATISFDELPWMEGSNFLIHQLFYNLINNSLKFSSPDKKPVISLSAAPATNGEVSSHNLDTAKQYIKLTLQDNGIGFSNEYAGKIFGTFTRLHSKDKYEGTGLGLSLCKKIVERHGGAIYAEGREGEGATFYILLPKS